MMLIIIFVCIAMATLFVIFRVLRPQFQGTPGHAKRSSTFEKIADKYTTLEEVQEGLRAAGLESSNLVVGVDFTASNAYQGERSFGGRSLHTVLPDLENPYQRAIRVIGRTLERFDEDGNIPAFGFGDITTKDHGVFTMTPDPLSKRFCHGVEEVLQQYENASKCVQLSGPTNFAPVINAAVDVLCSSGRTEFHILLIIADGQVVNEQDTIDAIVRASDYPLSIVCIGVGDGPWKQLETYDDELPARRFDNFQFVNFHEVEMQARRQNKSFDTLFAISALQEIPEQFNACKRLGLLGRKLT